MASVDDNEELIATRRLHGLDDNLFKESDKNVVNMTEEAFNELIDNFEVVAHLTMYGRKGIKDNVKRLQARIKELEEENKSKQKAYDDCYCEYKHYKQFESVPVQKVIDRINYCDKRIKHAKQIRDKEQEEFYIDLKRAFNKLLEEK